MSAITELTSQCDIAKNDTIDSKNFKDHNTSKRERILPITHLIPRTTVACKFETCKMKSFETDYEITQNIIGFGANGNVFEGFRKLDNKKIVIKFLQPTIDHLKSISLHHSIDPHSNLIELYDYYYCSYKVSDDNIQREWIVSIYEFAEGIELFDYVVANKSIPEDRIKEIAYQTGSVIKYLADRGLMHMDIKLENIIYNPDSRTIKVIDTDYLCNFKNNIIFRGTYDYISWELAINSQNSTYVHQITDKSDLWSLGVIIYTCIRQYHPFNIEDNSGKYNIQDIILFNYEKLTNKDASSGLLQLLNKIFVKPDARITITEFINDPYFIKE